MKKGYTHIVMVLDSSYSIELNKMTGSTIEGYNSFLARQKEVPGEATLSQYRFADSSNLRGRPGPGFFGAGQKYKLVESFVKLAGAQNLTKTNYIPDGGTPLLDTIGAAIEETGNVLRAQPESERPDKVVFVILTDGEENQSRTYNREQILSMIKHQTDAYQWDFIFLGAGQDAIGEAAKLGIAPQFAASYNADAVSTRAAFSTMSAKLGDYRGIMDKGAATASLNFTAEERVGMVAPNAADAGAGVQVNVGIAVGAGAINPGQGAGVVKGTGTGAAGVK